MRVPLTPIGGGLNESLPPSEQRGGTYVDGVNVRGIDARTGQQVFAAQRAGLSAEGDALPGGAYATHFTSAARLISARELRTLDTPVEEWAERLGESVLDVSEGLDGQGYFLLASGDVAVLNSKGTEVERIRSAAPARFMAVPRVYAVEDGSVYTAATRDEALDGGAGRVYRWVRQEDKTWTQAWEAIIETRISVFVADASVVYVAEDGPENEEGIRPPAALTKLGAPTLSPDIAWRETVFPRPCFDLTLGSGGQVFSSHPSNADRGGSVLFTARNVDWTPFSLPNFAGGNCWAWIDGLAVNDEGDPVQDGDEVRRIRDRRFESSDIATLDPDTPVRELGRNRSGVFELPTWDQSAFGGVGGVKFSGLSSLVSEFSTSTQDVDAQALIPAGFPSWTAVLLVQFTEEQAAQTGVRQVLQQRTNNSTQPDWQMTVTETESVWSDRRATGGASTQPLDTGAASLSAIVTLEADGAGSAIRCRVNGADVTGNVTFTSLTQGGPYSPDGSSAEIPGPFTVLGAGRPNRTNILTADGVVLETEDGANAILDRVRNGNRTSSAESQNVILGGAPGSSNRVGSRLQIDLGAARVFDSIAFWSSSTAQSASRAEVRMTNTAGFTTFDETQIFDIERGSGDNSAVRTEVAIENQSLNAYRYIEIEATAWHGAAETWQLAEIELFIQDTRETDRSAEFVFGEMVLYRNTGNVEREFVEGYIAHRWGLAHELDSGHQFFGPGNFPMGPDGTANDQDEALVRARLSSPYAILAKYGADGTTLAAYAGAGVGCGAAYQNGQVWAVGEPDPGPESVTPDYGTTLTRFRDDQRELERQTGIADTVFSVSREPAGLTVGPCSSLFLAERGGLRRINGQSMAVDWLVPTVVGQPLRAAPAGLQVDQTLQGGDCGPEYLYVAEDGLQGALRRSTMSLVETGEERGRDIELLAVTSLGDVVRRNAEGWETVESGALRGRRPGSATLYGRTFFADGTGYRVYDPALGQLRDFEAAAKGSMPPRCELIAAYRGRLVVARGDNAFTVYQSRFGDPFDFEFGTEINSIAQAAAGTTAAQGNSPEPITALMPWRDDLLYIGTTESLFVLQGDLADGGRLDHVDKSQGVAPGYAWCESPRGIYYFTGRGGVMLVGPRGLELVSAPIQRRLEEIDLQSNRVELVYNWVDRCVHVFVYALNGGDQVVHYCYEEPLGAWHIDSFGDGYGLRLTAAAALVGDTPEERSVFLGLGDGRAYRWDQYADDDAGRAVKSRATFGPLIDVRQNQEARVSGLYGVLSSTQAGVDVGVRGSNTYDKPGPPTALKGLRPGRGLGVPFNVAAPSLHLEVQGQGRAWAIHGLQADITMEGAARPV